MPTRPEKAVRAPSEPNTPVLDPARFYRAASPHPFESDDLESWAEEEFGRRPPGPGLEATAPDPTSDTSAPEAPSAQTAAEPTDPAVSSLAISLGKWTRQQLGRRVRNGEESLQIEAVEGKVDPKAWVGLNHESNDKATGEVEPAVASLRERVANKLGGAGHRSRRVLVAALVGTVIAGGALLSYDDRSPTPSPTRVAATAESPTRHYGAALTTLLAGVDHLESSKEQGEAYIDGASRANRQFFNRAWELAENPELKLAVAVATARWSLHEGLAEQSKALEWLLSVPGVHANGRFLDTRAAAAAQPLLRSLLIWSRSHPERLGKKTRGWLQQLEEQTHEPAHQGVQGLENEATAYEAIDDALETVVASVPDIYGQRHEGFNGAVFALSDSFDRWEARLSAPDRRVATR